MTLLLDLAYILLLAVCSPWLAWQSFRTGKYRQGFAEKFLGRAPWRESDRPCIWLHAVSVGEVNLLAPLIRELTASRPDCELYLTTTTQTGFALAKKKYGAAGMRIAYCPLDFSWAVRAAIQRIRPSLMVLVELELWPNLIRLNRAQGVAVAIVNGRLSERSYNGYRRLRWLIAPLLRQIDLIAVQSAEYAQRFLSLGARPATVEVTGSLKFDGAPTDRNNPATRRLRELAGFGANDIVFLAGSTQEPEESLALETFRALSAEYPQLRLVIVPRHPERFAAVARMLDASGLDWVRRSELAKPSPAVSGSTAACDSRLPSPDSRLCRLLLVDTIGELGAWWGTAQIGFVGGSLSTRGGQNMIEPCALGVATCFGPNTQNFRDVVAMLLAVGAAEVVSDGEALTTFVRRMLEQPEQAAQLAQRSLAVVTTQLGATHRTIEDLLPLLPASDTRARKIA